LFALLLSSSVISAQNDRGYIVKVGEEAPLFYTNNNNAINNLLKKYKGKVIMLQFTASWCSVCITEMPFIEKEIWEKYKNNDEFILLGLAKDTERQPQEKKEIHLMVEKTDVTYPILSDTNSQIFELFAEKNAGVTRNVIINQNGEIAFLTRLFEQKEFNEMINIIDELLKND